MHHCHGCRTLKVPLICHLIFRLFVLYSASHPALVKEFNGEADDFIICDYSFVLICHLSTVFV